MTRRLKLLATSVLLTCFALLAGARTVCPLRSIDLDNAFSVSAQNAGLRYVTLEVSNGAADLHAPSESHLDFIQSDPAPRRSSTREQVFIPAGP